MWYARREKVGTGLRALSSGTPATSLKIVTIPSASTGTCKTTGLRLWMRLCSAVDFGGLDVVVVQVLLNTVYALHNFELLGIVKDCT